MPIDPGQVKWDDIDSSRVQWDAPVDLKRQLAEETPAFSLTDRNNAFTIAAGRIGESMFEGLKQGGLGMGAIFAELLPDRLKAAAQEEIAKRLMAQEKRMQAKGGREEYKALEEAHPVATSLGEAAPIVAAPLLRVAAGPGAGAAAINAAASTAIPGVIEYGTPEEKVTRGLVGGAAGAGGSLLTSGAAKVLRGVTNVLTPEARRLAALAEEKFNIPLDAAQRTGSKALQTVDAAFEQMPATSGAAAVKKNAQRTAFTREVMKTLGEQVDEATPATLTAASKRIGGDFERIFGKVHVNLDDEAVQANLAKVVQDAADTLTPDHAAIVVKRVSQLLDKVDDNGAVAGKAYQAWRSEVQKQAKGTGDEWLGTQLRNLYRAVDDAAYKAAADLGEEGALRTARGQYKNMKTIEPLIAKSEDGTISPKLLRELVARANPDFAKGGGGDLGELAKIGRAFVADQVPNSGTAQRQLAQTLLTGGAVGGGTYMLTEDPQKAMAYGAGAMALPKAVQAALSSNVGQRYLSRGIRPNLSPLELALMDRSARLGALGLAQSGGE